MVFFFLLASDGPLFQFFLIPIEFQFDLFHLLIDPKDPHLDVVESFLIIYNNLIEFLYLTLETPTLPLCDLPEMILGFSFLIFAID